MSVYKFYDTCSLLKRVENLFDTEDEMVIISTITLKELEHIKTSAHKDVDTKYAAKRIGDLLDANPDRHVVEIFTLDMLAPIDSHCLEVTDDTRILATAIACKEKYENLTFVTNDRSLRRIARIFFDAEHIESAPEVYHDPYCGYKDIRMNEDEMAVFYSNQTENNYGLKVNEYIIVRDSQGEIVDTLLWTEEGYRKMTYQNFNSKWFGDVKPSKGDIYQAMVADSFAHNKITMVKGPAGSGKTYLSLGFLLSQLERGKLDKIIVFCNTIATKNSAKLGFLPGTRDEKLLDSQIGNLLISKIGGRVEVERMIEDEQLVLLPMSDIRGYDTGGMRAGIYISEAQNLDIDLMKLALQRIGDDSICIIDGDEKTQVDDIHFAGANNGMRRASKVFRGEDIYGEVELRIIHRSKIAKIAEKM